MVCGIAAVHRWIRSGFGKSAADSLAETDGPRASGVLDDSYGHGIVENALASGWQVKSARPAI